MTLVRGELWCVLGLAKVAVDRDLLLDLANAAYARLREVTKELAVQKLSEGTMLEGLLRAITVGQFRVVESRSASPFTKAGFSPKRRVTTTAFLR